jgi:hypothetical protein
MYWCRLYCLLSLYVGLILRKACLWSIYSMDLLPFNLKDAMWTHGFKSKIYYAIWEIKRSLVQIQKIKQKRNMLVINLFNS